MVPKGASLFSSAAKRAARKLFLRTMASGLVSNNALSSVDNTFRQKFVRVSILGADTPTGEATAFLLKQNPIVSQIYLYGEAEVRGIAADLKHLDTRSEIKAYWGKDGLPSALRRADIVLLVGLGKEPLHAAFETKLRHEAQRLADLAEACSRYAPKSLIAVCVNPVSSTLPMAAAIFRRTHWYHPGRLIGSVALSQIRANSFAARYQDLDPLSVHVPLVGGPDNDNIVPLFSRATPVSLMPSDCDILHERIKSIEVDSPIKTAKTPCKLGAAPLSEAYSINQLVTTMGLGLCGDDKAICAAFVRQTIIPTCRHLVCTVKFGPGGVVHNYGVPQLTKTELKLLEKVVLRLHKNEQLALDILAQIDKRRSTPISSMVKLSPYTEKSQTLRD